LALGPARGSLDYLLAVSHARLDLVQLADNTLTRARSRGAAEVASLAAARAAETIFDRDKLVLLVREAGGDPPDKQGLELGWATAADGPRYARDIGSDSAETFTRRLRDDTGCFLVADAGRIVHATWATTEAAWTRELRRYIAPPEGDAYVYESYTTAGARGRGLYPLALRFIAAELAARGTRDVWVAVENRNLASLRAVSKASFEAVAEIAYRRLLGRVTVQPPRRLGGFDRELPGLLDHPVRSRRAHGSPLSAPWDTPGADERSEQ
jgi:ribosomal protein S18 acetylase RimI-like enzyme